MKRNTLQKEIIINTIKKHGHLTKEEVIGLIIKDYPSISVSTVYRNLESLKEDNVLRECSINGIGYVYEFIHDTHDHFICEKCRRIIDIPKVSDNLDFIKNEEVSSKLKEYVVKYHQINYYGICEKCRNNLG